MTSADSPCDWQTARRRARSVTRRLRPLAATPEEAVGSVLAEPLRAQADIPAYDTATTDGWAVSGPGPWRIRQASRRDMFAGLDYFDATTHTRLLDGQATPVVAGESLGGGVSGVVSSARSVVDGDLVKLPAPGDRNRIEIGSGIRPRASDAATGDQLLPAGERITPAVAALAALSGHDELRVIPMPTVGLIRIGEVLDQGVPRSGLHRDAVSPALPGWIAGLGARCQPARWVTQGDGELIDVIDDLLCDIVVTTGPAAGAAVRRVLGGMRAELLVSSVECQPGGSMLFAQLQDGRPILHCGDIPIDAIATLLTLLSPLIETLRDRPDPAVRSRMPRMLIGDRHRTNLMPVRYTGERAQNVELISPGGPGGLFALSQADGLAVIPPGGIRSNEPVTVLPMP